MAERDEEHPRRSAFGTDIATAGRAQPRTADELAAALTSLRTAAGLSIRAVSRKTGIPSATLGGYFAGRHLPQVSQMDSFATLLEVLGVPAAEVPAWRETLQRIRRAPSGGRRTPSPYRGLDSYRVADADWFFGRTAETDQLAATVADARSATGPRMVALVGASGSGKSSLLHAGLIARLRADGWDAVSMRPGANPVTALEEALAGFAGDGSLLLVVDQLEDIFTSTVSDDERKRLLAWLWDLACGPDGPVVVVGLRADRYEEALRHEELESALSGRQVLLRPPGLETLRRIITEPARVAGRPVDDGLTEVLTAELRDGEHGARTGVLPLLSHVLWRTWESSGTGPLTVADYFAAGGLAGAVQKSAEHIYGDQLTEPQRQLARKLFLRMVDVDETDRASCRPMQFADLAEDVVATGVVDAFLDGRILTASEDAVHISHEALLGSWPRLRKWLQEEQDTLRLARRIGRAARYWSETGRDPSALLRGAMLDLATADDGGTMAWLSGLERAFVDESCRADLERRAGNRRRRNRFRALGATAAVLAVVASLLSVYLLAEVGTVDRQRQQARIAQRQAVSRQVAAQVPDLRSKDPSLAAQLALAAYRVSPTTAARSALLASTAVPATTRLVGPPGATFTAVSPTGHTIAVAGADGRIRVYTRPDPGRAPSLVATVPGYGGKALFAIAFSPDGRLVAAAGMAGRITVVDVSRPGHPTVWSSPLVGGHGTVYGLAFSPDSSRLLAATSDGSLLRWRLGAGSATSLPTEGGLPGPVQTVAVSARGLVAAGTATGRVLLWRPDGNRLRRVGDLELGAGNAAWSVAFSPDGRLLAVGAKDERVRVWQVPATAAEAGKAGEPVQPRLVTDKLGGFTSWVNAVAFSPDGQELAAGASGSLARVWRTSDWSLVASVPQSANVTSVGLLPDGSLLTAGLDGVTRLRSNKTPTLGGFGDAIGGLAVTGDGSRLYVGPRSTVPTVVPVAGASAGTLHRTGQVLTTPSAAGVPDQVVSVSPDGSALVVGTRTGHLVVWRLHDGVPDQPVVLDASAALIEEAAFSPDGRFFGSVSDDGTVSVYTAPSAGHPPRLAYRFNSGGMDLSLAFSPDSSLRAASGIDQKVHLWRLGAAGSVTRLAPLGGFSNYVEGLRFSPGGSLLAAGSADHTVRVWNIGDPNRPRLLARLTGPTNSVVAVAFSPDGRLLAGAGHDGVVWLWRLHPHARPSLDAQLAMPDPDARSVVFDPANGRLVAGSGAGTLREWATDPRTAARLVCATAGHPLTGQEWRRYFHNLPPHPPCK